MHCFHRSALLKPFSISVNRIMVYEMLQASWRGKCFKTSLQTPQWAAAGAKLNMDITAYWLLTIISQHSVMRLNKCTDLKNRSI